LSEPALARVVDRYRNGTEREYALVLRARWRNGDYLDVQYEAVTFVLGPDLRYTPDFFVVRKDRAIEFHEVKGRKRPEGMVKLRQAARAFPWFRFCLVEKPRRRLLGALWQLTEIKP
jgi:hypothetical protein